MNDLYNTNEDPTMGIYVSSFGHITHGDDLQHRNKFIPSTSPSLSIINNTASRTYDMMKD